MKQRQYFKQTWFVVLMVFAMSWSVVSNAFAQPMHALMGMQQMSQSEHCTQQAVVAPDLAKHGSSHHQATPPVSNHCQALQSADHIKMVKSCPDCSTAYCQVSHLAVSQDAVVLRQPAWEVPKQISSTAYQAQHLLGFHQQILRPPRA